MEHIISPNVWRLDEYNWVWLSNNNGELKATQVCGCLWISVFEKEQHYYILLFICKQKDFILNIFGLKTFQMKDSTFCVTF